MFRAQELCEGPGGRPGLPVPNKPCVFCGRKATLKQKGTIGDTGVYKHKTEVCYSRLDIAL